jgi:hypothetical protein
LLVAVDDNHAKAQEMLTRWQKHRDDAFGFKS